MTLDPASTSVLAAVLAGWATAQAAEPPCDPVAALVEGLASRFGEVQQSGGLSGAGTLWATYANPETGTWTILEINPDGTACMRSFGKGWMGMKPEPKGDPA